MSHLVVVADAVYFHRITPGGAIFCLYYKGAPLPDDTSMADIDRLLELGMIGYAPDGDTVTPTPPLSGDVMSQLADLRAASQAASSSAAAATASATAAGVEAASANSVAEQAYQTSLAVSALAQDYLAALSSSLADRQGLHAQDSQLAALLMALQDQVDSLEPDGSQVMPGPPGQSAYDVWLAAGHSGTTSDFLAALVGPPGSAAADGRSSELRLTGGAVEWRQTGGAWVALIPLSMITGPQGPQGATGSTGLQGPMGPVGPKGDTGNTGNQGATGATGAVGSAGPAGATGQAGVQGVTGPAGAKGDTGTTGATGPAGTAGAVGASGAKGDTGSTGAAGAVGPQGPIGLTGPTGSQGVKGDTGTTGPSGAQGVKGDTGAVGATGAQGVAGPAGSTGQTGSVGATGSQGVKGDTGLTGPTGTTGATGAAGSTGPAGTAGATGATGAAGTAGVNAIYRHGATTGLTLKIYTAMGSTDATGAVTFPLPASYFATVTFVDPVVVRDTANPVSATFAMARTFSTSSVVVQTFESKSSGVLVGGVVEGLEAVSTAGISVQIAVYGY